MAILKTSTCHAHDHPEIQISFDPNIAIEADARWFMSWLEQSVARGSRFAPGETCQVGWLVAQFRRVQENLFSVWEPDLRAMPVAWTESVNNLLTQLRLQKDVVESVLSAEELCIPSMVQSAIICTRLGKAEGVVMERSEPAGTDSGWFCGCSEEDHSHNDVAELRRLSLYEAAVRGTNQIIPYLALPAGVLISVSAGAPVIFQNGRLLEFKTASFLAARHSRR